MSPDRLIQPIASVMNNLKRKGYLNAEQHGLTYHFSPRIASLNTNLISCVVLLVITLRISSVRWFLFFAKEEDLSPEDLKEIINEIESGND